MAKNYINDNNRWKQKGANMVERAYGASGFFDKVGDAISGVANTVGNVANSIGDALSGGNDPQPPASGGGGGGLGNIFSNMIAKAQAMRANAMANQMGMQNQGGDGREVTVRGRIINDQFRPHFKGGFGPGMNYTTTETKKSKKQLRKQARENKVPVQKMKLKKEYKDQTSDWLPMSAYNTKTKFVTQKRADRMTGRKSGNWKQMVYGASSNIEDAQKALFQLNAKGDSIRAQYRKNLQASPQLANQLDSLRNLKKNLPPKDLFGPREQELTDQIRAVDNKIKKAHIVKKGNGASINLKNLGGNLKDIIKGDPDVKKARIASREKNIALRQAEKTKRRSISAKERTERIKARNK